MSEPTLFDAARRGDVERIKAYFGGESAGSSSEFDSRRMTMLHHAAHGGQTAVVALILDQRDCNTDAVDLSEWTALHYAAGAGHCDIVRLLIDAGCNTAAKDEMKRSALHLVATSGVDDDTKIAMAKMLTANGCNFRLKNVGGLTAADCAKASNASDAVLAALAPNV